MLPPRIHVVCNGIMPLSLKDHNIRTTTYKDPRTHLVDENYDIPQYKRDFQLKSKYLRDQFCKVKSGQPCKIVVHRQQLFQSAFAQIMAMSPAALKSKLYVEFAGESGLDYGGTRTVI